MPQNVYTELVLSNKKITLLGDPIDPLDAVHKQYVDQKTGIPVYADAAARDAAYGGANPPATEGMFCYLQDSDSFQVYDFDAWRTLISAGVLVGTTDVNNVLALGTSTDVIQLPTDAASPEGVKVGPLG